jgi:drug/metabolite transporter (DMT)-like permease
VLYGLLAALGWGVSAIAAAVAVRRARTFVVVLLSQGLGVLAMLMLAIVWHAPLAALTAPMVAGLASAGLIGLLGYLTFYRSVALGQTGLMSAISSTYGGVATVLAVGILGERLAPIGAVGVVLAIGGVAMAAARPGVDTAAVPGGVTGTAGPAGVGVDVAADAARIGPGSAPGGRSPGRADRLAAS